MVQKKLQLFDQQRLFTSGAILDWGALRSVRFAGTPEHRERIDKDTSHKAEQLAAAVLLQSLDGCRAKGGITGWHTWK